MRLSFFGAAHEVTGSCHLLEACGKNILIDCGMEQGPDLYENQELPVTPGEVDYILLTHAHIDHSGNIPLLVKKGFSGEIITTFATADLCDIMLRDSAHIQEFEAEWRNRKARRSGEPEYEPIYTVADADAATKLLAPVDYGQKITLCDGIEVRFNDVGHLLGSASIEVWVTEGDHQRSAAGKRSRLCSDRIYIWRPDTWRGYSGLCRRIYKNFTGNIPKRRQCSNPIVCGRTYAGNPVFYQRDKRKESASGIPGI